MKTSSIIIKISLRNTYQNNLKKQQTKSIIQTWTVKNMYRQTLHPSWSLKEREQSTPFLAGSSRASAPPRRKPLSSPRLLETPRKVCPQMTLAVGHIHIGGDSLADIWVAGVAGLKLAASKWSPRQRCNLRPIPTPSSWLLLLIIFCWVAHMMGELVGSNLRQWQK